MTEDSNVSSSRRNFLKTAGLIGGSAVAAGVGAIAYTDHGELDNDFPDIKESQVILRTTGTVSTRLPKY